MFSAHSFTKEVWGCSPTCWDAGFAREGLDSFGGTCYTCSKFIQLTKWLGEEHGYLLHHASGKPTVVLQHCLLQKPVEKRVTARKRVLLVEGPLTVGLADLLKIEEYQVVTAQVEEVLRHLRYQVFDSVILDPWAAGLNPESYQVLIAAVSCPLFLVLPPASEHVRLIFLAAPPGRFTPLLQSLSELFQRPYLWRVDALQQPHIHVGDINIDLARWQVTRQDQVVPLSTTEFRLLAYLAANRNRAVGYDELVRAVWGYNTGDRKLVANLVSRLRRKLGADLLCNVRGYGYRLCVDSEGE